MNHRRFIVHRNDQPHDHTLTRFNLSDILRRQTEIHPDKSNFVFCERRKQCLSLLLSINVRDLSCFSPLYCLLCLPPPLPLPGGTWLPCTPLHSHCSCSYSSFNKRLIFQPSAQPQILIPMNGKKYKEPFQFICQIKGLEQVLIFIAHRHIHQSIFITLFTHNLGYKLSPSQCHLPGVCAYQAWHHVHANFFENSIFRLMCRLQYFVTSSMAGNHCSHYNQGCWLDGSHLDLLNTTMIKFTFQRFIIWPTKTAPDIAKYFRCILQLTMLFPLKLVQHFPHGLTGRRGSGNGVPLLSPFICKSSSLALTSFRKDWPTSGH